MSESEKIDVNQLIVEYQSGMSLSKLAKKYRCRHPTIRNLLKNKIVLRTQSEATRKYDIKEDFFDQIDSEQVLYVLGFISADGFVMAPNQYNRNKGFEIQLHEKDVEILRRISILLYGNTTHVKKVKTRDHVRLIVSNQRIGDKLLEYGIAPRKSFTLTYPKVISDLNLNLQRHFIRGYFDGDGCIYGHAAQKHNRAQYQIAIMGTKEFCTTIRTDIIPELNINSRIVEEHNTGMYTVRIGGNRQVKKFCDWMYSGSSIFLSRKFQKYLDLTNVCVSVDKQNEKASSFH